MRWQTKAIIQSVLARIPYGERINHALQRANPAREAASASRVEDLTRSLRNLAAQKKIAEAIIVEVGTGWDAMPTLWLSAQGAGRIYTYDHLSHLRVSLAVEAARTLQAIEPENRELRTIANSAGILEEMLSRARITYRAPADAAKTGLPDASVDIYFSYAVLEHVSEAVANEIIREAKRVLKPDGIFFAVIGLHDHYVGMSGVSKVNFLQYPEWLWALLVKNKFSYHNRLRERDFLEILLRHGASIIDVKGTIDPADLHQVKTMKINHRFHGYSSEELATTRTEITARFPRGLDVPAFAGAGLG